jgi:glycosyltransferase involved in cell wall biosynthesis
VCGVSVTLALSTLCEHPRRRTGLTTLFRELVVHALKAFPEVRWIVMVGPESPWDVVDARVTVVRDFPANDRRAARLWADHFYVAAAAKARGAAALLTVGFVPVRMAGLPVVMHVFSVHHLRKSEGVRSGSGAGWAGIGAMYRRWAVERGLRRAALVVVNSRWTAAQVGGQMPGDVDGEHGQAARATGRVLVSYEGVDHGRFRTEAGEAAVRERVGLPAEYVLWASNFYGYKRAPLAIAAYARMAAEVRERFPLVLVGGDWAGGRAEAERAARAAGVERDVRFLGWVDDAVLPAVYRGARAHVLATREETFGRSVAEAMACGCPCVVQDLTVLREVAEDAAVYVDFADASAAGTALARVCEDDVHAERLRQAGLVRARAFSFERLARERVGAILERLAEGAVRR